jgi:phosphinothricin acetyltransferase
LSTASIRRAVAADAAAINAIYNDAVLKTTATMDTEPKTLEYRQQWLERHQGRHGVLVAQAPEDVVAWASLSAWSDRPAYGDTCESSVYVAEAWRGKGVGRALMTDLLGEADRNRFHVVLARVSTENAASLRLHETLGFSRVGVMREVGFKFGRRQDVVLMQRLHG